MMANYKDCKFLMNPNEIGMIPVIHKFYKFFDFSIFFLARVFFLSFMGWANCLQLLIDALLRLSYQIGIFCEVLRLCTTLCKTSFISKIQWTLNPPYIQPADVSINLYLFFCPFAAFIWIILRFVSISCALILPSCSSLNQKNVPACKEERKS